MRYLKFVLFPLLLIVLAGPFFVIPKVLELRKVSCSTQFGECSEALRDKLDGNVGRKLSEAKKSIRDVLSAETSVEEFAVRFRLPSEYKIDLILKKPKYGLKNPQGSVALVDGGGMVVAFVEETNLPVVIYEGKLPNVDGNVSPQQAFALEVVYNMFYYHHVKQGEVKDNMLVCLLPEGIEVVFPLEGDKRVLMGSLRLILSRLNDEREGLKIERVSRIDLRFRNPVLK